jgi:hypothetical protein
MEGGSDGKALRCGAGAGDRHQQLPQIVSYRHRYCHCYNTTPRSIVAVPCANRPNERPDSDFDN